MYQCHKKITFPPSILEALLLNFRHCCASPVQMRKWTEKHWTKRHIAKRLSETMKSLKNFWLFLIESYWSSLAYITPLPKKKEMVSAEFFQFHKSLLFANKIAKGGGIEKKLCWSRSEGLMICIKCWKYYASTSKK